MSQKRRIRKHFWNAENNDWNSFSHSFRLLLIITTLFTFILVFLFSYHPNLFATKERVSISEQKLNSISKTIINSSQGNFSDLQKAQMIDEVLQSFDEQSNELENRYLTEKDGDTYYLFDSIFSSQHLDLGFTYTHGVDDESTPCLFVLRVCEVLLGKGLKEGNNIYAINGISIDNEEFPNVLNDIVDGVSESITLSLSKDGEKTLTYTFPSYLSSNLEYYTYKGYMVFLFHYFSEGISDTFISLYESLLEREGENWQGIVFDVSDTSQGLYEEAVSILDYLVPKGEFVIIKDGNTTKTYSSNSDGTSIPIGILVSYKTAGIAEMFTAVLQERNDAYVLGNNVTAGNQYLMNAVKLSDGSIFLYSDSSFELPSGKSIMYTGIIPDNFSTFGTSMTVINCMKSGITTKDYESEDNTTE